MKRKFVRVNTVGLRGLALCGSILLFAVLYSGVVKADTLVQGYGSDSQLTPGWVVSITKADPTKVEATPSKDPSRIFGVVVDPGSASITLNRQTAKQVFIASAGTYPVLINTENGNIKAGDYISLSSTSGIAAKATNQQEYVLGRALSDFNGRTGSITTTSGGYGIGLVSVSISFAKNPLVRNDAGLPAPLKKIGEALAGKPVSPVRVYASLGVFIITLVCAVSLLYVGVRSSIIAIGRNPLSRKSVLRSMLQILIVVIIVFIIGLFGVYLLLRL